MKKKIEVKIEKLFGDCDEFFSVHIAESKEEAIEKAVAKAFGHRAVAVKNHGVAHVYELGMASSKYDGLSMRGRIWVSLACR